MATFYRRDMVSYETPSKYRDEPTPPVTPDEEDDTPVRLKQHFQRHHLEGDRHEVVSAEKDMKEEAQPASSSCMTSIFGVMDCAGGATTENKVKSEPTPLYNEWGVSPGDDSSADGSQAYAGGPTPEQVLAQSKNPEARENFEMVLHDNVEQKPIQRTWSFGKKKKEEALLGIGKRQGTSAQSTEEWMPPAYFEDGYDAQLLATVSKDETEATQSSKKSKRSKLFGGRNKKSKTAATEEYDSDLKKAIDNETFGDKKKGGLRLFRSRSANKKKFQVRRNDTETPVEVDYDPVLKHVVETELHGDKADQYHRSMLALAAKEKARKDALVAKEQAKRDKRSYDKDLKRACETEIQGSAADRFPGSFWVARSKKKNPQYDHAYAVPGTNAILHDEDLVGDEYVEEDDHVPLNKEERGVNATKAAAATASGFGLSAVIMSVFRGREQGETYDNEPDYIRNAYTWIEEQTVDDPYRLERQKSAPMAMMAKSFSFDRSKKKKKEKPLWRAAIDPATGREYYYHRETRETTWKKPDGVTILPPKEIPQEIHVGDDEEEKKEDDGSVDSDGPLRKKTLRDFDPEVWRKKTEIYDLLQSMSPPDGTSVKKLMRQYDGREDELLEQLRDLNAEQGGTVGSPFDEPLEEYSMRTGVQSVRTAQIRNTSRGDDEDVSSFSGVEERRRQVRDVPRARELVVEDLATDRVTATYDRRGARDYDDYDFETRKPAASRAARIRAQAEAARLKMQAESSTKVGNSPARSEKSASPGRKSVSSSSLARSTDASKTNDGGSISGLTDNDIDFVRQNRLDKARRRALDDAIAKEDWARAAQLSEALRANRKPTSATTPRAIPRNLKESSLDRFISENDWDAVSDYIAGMRNRDKLPPRPMGRRPDVGDDRLPARSRTVDPQSTDSDSASKRFGATSQLQQPSHEDAPSVSSWESEYSDEDYTSGDSYSSDDQLRYAVRSEKRRPRHFAT